MFRISHFDTLVPRYSSIHSHKILTIQQGKPCYLGILCNPCSDPERCQAGRASLSCSCTESNLGEMIKIVCVHCACSKYSMQYVYPLVYTSAKFSEASLIVSSKFSESVWRRGKKYKTNQLLFSEYASLKAAK